MTDKLDYYRDSLHTYMVIRCEDSAAVSGYQYRMMEMNRIKGLLACDIRSIDGQKYLYYDITGRQSMYTLFEGRAMRESDVLEFLTSLRDVRSSLASFLLDEVNLVLDSRQIYYDFTANIYVFTYNPGAAKGDSHIFAFLSDKIDASDHEAAAMVYRLCEIAETDPGRIHSAIEEELRRVENESEFAEFSDVYVEDSRTGSSPASDQKDDNVIEHSKEETQPVKEPVSKEHGTKKLRLRSKRKRSHRQNDSKSAEYHPGNTHIILRIFMAVLIFAGMIGLFVMPEVLLLNLTIARLCRVGSALLLVVEVFMLRDLWSGCKERTAEKEQKSGVEKKTLEAEYEKLFHDRGKKKNNSMQSQSQVGAEYNLAEGNETVLLTGTDLTGKFYGTGIHRGTRISFDKFPFTIGKAEKYVDCTLSDASISRMHARIIRNEEGKICIKDLGSTNGTYINGTRLGPNESGVLERGDEIMLGSVEFLYR